ncbi:phenylacetate--CoA ligase family protein [Chloroflexota bacterium]
MDLKKKIYKAAPGSVQRWLGYTYSKYTTVRYRKVFWGNYAFLQESQWWSRDKLEEYQMQQLTKLLNHAYENVPYYRHIFTERGLKPKDIQDFNDLSKLPYLTKEIIRENIQDLIAQNYPKSKLQYSTTGGSTGFPLGLYREKGVSNIQERAFMLSLCNRVGYKIGDRSVLLKSNVVHSASKGKHWEYDPVNKDLVLSSYHMTDGTLQSYLDKIREFKPAFIRAYPSTITVLARFMKENDIKSFPTVKAILCSSENLYQWQRDLLAQVFQCRVYSWYGNTEMTALAGECEKSNFYHIFPEYGFVEIIHDNDGIVTGEDGMGEIIATGLNNFACPIIRYRTMDLAVPSSAKCECGRNYPLLERIEGRLQDLVVTRDNRLVTLTALILGQSSFPIGAFSRIKQMQLVQEKKGEVTVKIVKGHSYSTADEGEILSKIQAGVGGGLDINFTYVDQIPRTKGGKYRYLIQKLPIESGKCIE